MLENLDVEISVVDILNNQIYLKSSGTWFSPPGSTYTYIGLTKPLKLVVYCMFHLITYCIWNIESKMKKKIAQIIIRLGDLYCYITESLLGAS